jgi:5-oxoprolinase (ATP-hydrolysing)
VNGPAIILNNTSTILVEPNWVAVVDDLGNLEMNNISSSNETDTHSFSKVEDVPLDAIELSIFSHRFMSIAE